MKYVAAVILSVLLSSFQFSSFSSLRYKTYDNKEYALKDLSQKKAIVFLFLMPDCPFCQKYTKTLNELHTEYSKCGIEFTGVVTGDIYTDKEVTDFIKTYRIKFSIIRDPQKTLTRHFGVSVSPSVVVSNANGKSQYKGLIDNWPITPGKTRQVITETYLKDALKQVTENKIVTVKNTDAVGCIIE